MLPLMLRRAQHERENACRARHSAHPELLRLDFLSACADFGGPLALARAFSPRGRGGGVRVPGQGREPCARTASPTRALTLPSPTRKRCAGEGRSGFSILPVGLRASARAREAASFQRPSRRTPAGRIATLIWNHSTSRLDAARTVRPPRLTLGLLLWGPEILPGTNRTKFPEPTPPAGITRKGSSPRRRGTKP